MEFLDIIDVNDKVIGKASRDQIYEEKLNHRIVHVMVINPETSQIYLQKRSMSVSYLPGYYSTSAGGHVLSGEDYISAAKRELIEELGIESELIYVGTYDFYFNQQNRKIGLFITFYTGDFKFKDGEVETGNFIDFNQARALIEKNDKIHPQLAFCFNIILKNWRSFLR